MRTKTCPLFRTGRMLTAVGIVLCYWLLRIQPRNPGQKYPLPALPMGADRNRPLFRIGRMLTAVGIVLCCWLLRVQPRNPGQKYPLPTLAMGADQNLSAFSDWQNANRRRNRAVLLASTHFSRGIQDRNLRSQPCPWVRTKTCPLFGVLIWHDGYRCPRSRKNFCRALLHQAARFMSMTGCRSGPREPSE